MDVAKIHLILCLLALVIYSTAQAAGGHRGIAHDATGHHTSGSTKTSTVTTKPQTNSTTAAPTTYTSAEFYQMEKEYLAAHPPPPPKPKNDYDRFMDAFKRNRPPIQTPDNINTPHNGIADNYLDNKGILRDSDTNRIHRSQTAIKHFRDIHPCPSTGSTDGTCPGYQVDHRIALKNGGADHPSNMRWLSIQEHQKKSANE